MKNNFKRFAAIVLAVLMVVSTVMPVFAADAACPGKGLAHTTDNCEYDAKVVAPTCTANGKTEYTCKTCGDKWSDSFVLALGHDYVEEVVAPTCTANGYTVKTCSRCKDSSTVTNAGALPAHTWVYEWTTEDVDACHGGSDWTKATCSVCGATKNNTDGKTFAGGHTWEITITKAPTCKTAGSATYTCTVCKVTKSFWQVDPYSNSNVPAGQKQHNAVVIATVSAATCTADKVVTYKCDVCGIFNGSVSGTAGHGINPTTGAKDYFEPLTAKAKTCTEDGIAAGDKQCKICGAHCNSAGVKYDTAKKKAAGILAGHNFPMSGDEAVWSVYQAATCTKAGIEKRTCPDCGTSETREVAAKGHAVPQTGKTTVPATCTTDGKVWYKCANCNLEIVESTSSATGHSYKFVNETYKDGGAVVDRNAPVCGAWYYVNEKCEDCDATTYTQQKFADHEYANKVEVKADCARGGYSLSRCKVCNALNPADVLGTHKTEGVVTTDNGKNFVEVSGTKYFMYDITEKDANTHNLLPLGDAGNVAVGKVTGEAFCTVGYTEHASCQNAGCEYVVERKVGGTGHTYDDADLDLTKYYTGVELAANFTEITRTAGTGTCLIKTAYSVGCVNCDNTKTVTPNDGTGKGHVADTVNHYTAAANATCTTTGTTEQCHCANVWCEYAHTAASDTNFWKVAETTGTLHNDVDLMVKVEMTMPVDDFGTHINGNKEYYKCPLGKDCAAASGSTPFRAYFASEADKTNKVLTPVTDFNAQVVIKIEDVDGDGHEGVDSDPYDDDHRHCYMMINEVYTGVGNNGNGKIVIPATCTSIGYTLWMCSRCFGFGSLCEAVAPTAHNYERYDSNNDGQVNDSDEYKVTYAGSCEEGVFATRKCADCGYVDSVDFGTGHYTVMNGKTATADQKLTGACDSRRDTCARCAKIIEPADHVYGDAKYVAGIEIRYCTVCDDESQTYHTCKFVDYKNNGAKHTATCACGETKTSAHVWDDGVETTAATETAEGVKTFTCIDCAATKTEKIAMLASTHKHTYKYESISDYKHEYVCECGDVKVAEEHNWKDGVCIDCLAKEAKSGCGSSVALMGVALVATLGTCVVFATKKKED